MIAVNLNEYAIAEYLCNKGADVNSIIRNGRTPFHMGNIDQNSFSYFYYKIIFTIKRTLAVINNRNNMIKLLRKYGANEMIKDKDDCLPIDFGI